MSNLNMKVFGQMLILNFMLMVQGYRNDRDIIENCMRSFEINPENYKALNKLDIKDVDKKIKCLDECLLKGYRVMNEDGTIDMDQIIQLISVKGPDDDQNIKRMAVETCSKKKGDNDCDTAYMMMTCLNEEMRKLSN